MNQSQRLKLKHNTRRNVGLIINQMVDNENQNSNRKPMSLELFEGKCLICQEAIKKFTHAHATIKHGYTSKEAMVAAGKFQYYERGKNR